MDGVPSDCIKQTKSLSYVYILYQSGVDQQSRTLGMIWSEVFGKGVRPCAAGGATGGMSASLLSLHLVLRLKSIYISGQQ